MNKFEQERRLFLKQTALLGTAEFFVACSPTEAPPQPTAIVTPDSQPDRSKDYKFSIDLKRSKEIGIAGLSHYPDGHITHLTQDNQSTIFISANDASYALTLPERPSFDSIPHLLSQTKPEKVYGPDQNTVYKQNYAAITSVLSTDEQNSNHLLGLTHNEWRKIQSDSNGYVATIGLIESFDQGKTWQDKGAVFHGQNPQKQDEDIRRTSGAGQPCGIIVPKDGKRFIYNYFVDWTGRTADQIYLAYAEIDTNGSVSKWQSPKQNGDLKPIVEVPKHIPGARYTALPSVSWNIHLQKYLMVFETAVGFCSTTSLDGRDWDTAKLIVKFPKNRSEEKFGDTRFSYPSLLSFSENSDQVTGKSGILAFSKGTLSHNLVIAPFELS